MISFAYDQPFLPVSTLALSMSILLATAAATLAGSATPGADNPELPDGTRAKQRQTKASVQTSKPRDDAKRLLGHVLGYEQLSKTEFDALAQRVKGDPQMARVLNDHRDAVRLFGEGLAGERTDYRSLLLTLAATVKSREEAVARADEIVRSLQRGTHEKERLVVLLATAMAEAPTPKVRTRLAYVLGDFAQRPTASDSGLSRQLVPVLKTLSRDPDELVRKAADVALAEFRSDETEPREVPRDRDGT